LELTLPDCDTFLPEFGLCLPPELQLNFNTYSSPTTSRPNDFDFSAPLSNDLQTPLTGRSHEFSLPGYGASAGNDYNGFGFSDDIGGFRDDDDDGLANADDADTLDFDLGPVDPTPTRPHKRVSSDNDTISKRARYTFVDGNDDEIQRIAREDHDNARRGDTPDNNFDSGFGDIEFAEYRTPPPLSMPPVDETINPPRKRRRVIIVEDDTSTVKDSDFRSWPEKYLQMQIMGNTRKKNLEMTRIAKQRALNYIWGWGGRRAGSLPPALDAMFSRIALMERWKGPTSDVVKRKRDDDGELEYPFGGFGDTGGGFGDGIGGFEGNDYSVYFEVATDDRRWKSLVMPKTRLDTHLFKLCRCHGQICPRDKLLDRHHKILKVDLVHVIPCTLIAETS
jgi:hypothetical protein